MELKMRLKDNELSEGSGYRDAMEVQQRYGKNDKYLKWNVRIKFSNKKVHKKGD